jgi:hypothetical protein
MDIAKMIAELRTEHSAIVEAITVLEKMAGTQRRRGRPPAWLKAIRDPEAPKKRAAKRKKSAGK